MLRELDLSSSPAAATSAQIQTARSVQSALQAAGVATARLHSHRETGARQSQGL
jgi:hypothetical protein